MNRASLALGLLLGTLAAALVAAGVARDLERAESRTFEPGVVNADRESESITRFSSREAPEVVVCSVSLCSPKSIAPLAFEPIAPRGLPIDWEQWTKQLIAVPQLVPPHVKQAEKTCRIIDRKNLARTLARHKPADTAKIDALILSNDGINDISDSGAVPFGHIAVGGRVVKLQFRGAAEGARFAWTGGLHYGVDRRRTLQPIDPGAALCRQSASLLPWETPRLWSGDCRMLLSKTTQAAKGTIDGLIISLTRIQAIVKAADWTHDRIDTGLASMAGQIKRQTWLATFQRLPQAIPVRSAQRQKSDKG